MPNTPAQIGQGMSVWTCSFAVQEAAHKMAQSILETVGLEIYVDDEKYLDMATALNGSGPAYVFLVIEALIDAGVYVGLPRAMARTVALQTVYGSTKLLIGERQASCRAQGHGGISGWNYRRGHSRHWSVPACREPSSMR